MKKQTIKRKDGTTVVISTAEPGEYTCDGYDAENDITKSHEEIICKVADIDLKTQAVIDEIEKAEKVKE